MCHYPDHGCEQHFHYALPRGWHHRSGCYCGPAYAPWRFPTREEVIEDLEEYLKQLKAEAKGLEERLAKLRKES